MKKQLTFGRIVSYLLYLSLVCTLIFGVTYARYSTEVTGGASAQTAAVALDSSLDLTKDLEGMKPGGDVKTISFSVSNKKDNTVSEVAQEYTITLLTTGNLPLEFTLASASGTADSGGSYALSEEAGNYIWRGGLFPAGKEETHKYTLTVTWPQDANDTKLMNEIDAIKLLQRQNKEEEIHEKGKQSC